MTSSNSHHTVHLYRVAHSLKENALKSSHLMKINIIASTGCIQWILWFSVCYAAAAAVCRQFFYVNALSGELHQLALLNWQDIVIGRLASLGLKLASS